MKKNYFIHLNIIYQLIDCFENKNNQPGACHCGVFAEQLTKYICSICLYNHKNHY